jgi:hypothetical protein
VQNNKQSEVVIYTEDQLMARLRFFIGICLALTLTGIVFVVLYSLIFVTQPLNAISPMDQKFFELIIPIATFLTGTLSGIMLAGKKPDDMPAPRPTLPSVAPAPTPVPPSGMLNGGIQPAAPVPVAPPPPPVSTVPPVPKVSVPIVKKPGE